MFQFEFVLKHTLLITAQQNNSFADISIFVQYIKHNTQKLSGKQQFQIFALLHNLYKYRIICVFKHNTFFYCKTTNLLFIFKPSSELEHKRTEWLTGWLSDWMTDWLLASLSGFGKGAAPSILNNIPEIT